MNENVRMYRTKQFKSEYREWWADNKQELISACKALGADLFELASEEYKQGKIKV